MDVDQDVEDIQNTSDVDGMDEFVEGGFDDEEIMENNADEISTLMTAIGTIDETSSKPFSRGEHCHKAIARLEYLLRSEYIKNRRIKDDHDDDDTDNNEIFAKCGEFMLFTKKLIPCFKSLMEDIIKCGIDAERSKPLLQTTQRLIKMFTRFTFALCSDINNKTDYYIKQNKYQQFAEYQAIFKKALIEHSVLYYILILISHCGLDLDPDERGETQIDSLELYLCLLRNILSIPNSTTDLFLHDRALLAFHDEKVMDVLVELAVNIYEESEKIQYLLSDIFYEYFKLEDAEAMICNKHSSNNEIKSLCSDIKREKQQRKSKLKRSRHGRWGGLSRVKMLNGQSRIQSLATNQMSNNNMFDRRKLPRLRPMKERKKRVYLSNKIPKALSYVADIFVNKSFTVLINSMLTKIQKMPEFQLNESNDAKKCFTLIALFLQYHRIKTRKVAAAQAKKDKVSFSGLKWYSSSSISCVLNENFINFILKRIEALIESRSFKHVTVEPERVERALTCYKEIIRSIYSMIEYGNDANKANGIKLFSWIFEDHRGPQLITDMIRDYKQHQNTKLYLSYCIETVYYTLSMVQKLQNDGGEMSFKSKKKKRKKKNNTNNEHTNNEEREQMEEGGDEHNVEVAGMEIHDDEYEDEQDQFEFVTKRFDLESFLKSYAANKVIANYMYILEDFASNSAKLNSYIITLFDTLAFKMNYIPLLFQLSYFLIFNEILENPIIARDKKQYVLIKFCKKIAAEFFSRADKNPVLFCEILFHKTAQAISDINEPGTVHKQLLVKQRKDSERMERRNNIRGMEDIDDDDFDEEEEYEQIADWTEAEDNLLRNYYPTYSQQLNVLNILQDFLQTELQITRPDTQIHARLRVLGLRTGRMHSRKQQNAVKKRIKPQEMTLDMRKSIIYHCIHRACNVENESNARVNKDAFEWIHAKLSVLCDAIEAFIDVSTTLLLDDIAIVPVQLNEFSFIENICINGLLTKLGFLAPNQYTGTIWWRIPREFKTTEIRDMIKLMKEGLELGSDADLKSLCGNHGDSMQIALLNEKNEVEEGINLMDDLAPREARENINENNMEINEIENDDREGSDSEEEEYKPRAISQLQQNEPQNDTEGNEEDVNDENVNGMNVETEKDEKKKKDKSKKKKKDKKSKKKKKKDKKSSKRKKKKESRKRKRDKMEKDGENESDDDDNDNERRKRRRLNVNNNNNNDDEENFFDDMEEVEEENENNENVIVTEMETSREMNTPQIRKFGNLKLSENDIVLNSVTENKEAEEDDEDLIPIKRHKKSKRNFVSDSDSD